MSNEMVKYVAVASSPLPVITTALTTGVLGFVAGQFIRLPGLTVVCDNPVPFSAISILFAVYLCLWSQWTLYRSTREVRLLGADLREMLYRSETYSGASE